ncbi:PadR family transcriptional regulator [Alkaliphilus transvaalensis]|uniref:PadR family transcriptional regulator n=1 Tax=Alkaliphilus transvaalensis TaxID=114628 RepID=UPI000688D996|nr:PadR family transcriptional regulator [Alkaliphilus transvaalensis]
MIKFVILGFLMHKDLTGYDIKQIMLQSTSNFMNSSFGSIYPALDKLEKNGYVNSTKLIEKGKYKKVYSINDGGRVVFMKWLEEPIDFMKSYEEILAKVFFYGHLPREKATELITQLIIDINKKIKELEELEVKLKSVAGIFEASTLIFGLDHLKFMQAWYEKFLIDLNKDTGGDNPYECIDS